MKPTKAFNTLTKMPEGKTWHCECGKPAVVRRGNAYICTRCAHAEGNGLVVKPVEGVPPKWDTFKDVSRACDRFFRSRGLTFQWHGIA